jgi:2-dehydro-3-deoxyphosphogluconate aldolase / (4S)-4-hydroxy-2-oxoglutarate aldolase
MIHRVLGREQAVAHFSRLEVLNEIIETGLVPLFDATDIEVAKRVVCACVDGGAHVVEFRNRGDRAFMTFAELSGWAAAEQPALILGVGTVLDPATAALYLACGAAFVVSPVLNPEIARVCNRQKVAYVPGCGSVSEISAAEELGVEICKIFPGKEIGGPDFVRAALAPCPHFRLMPTGGVDATEESVTAWIKAGAACLGMGARLITSDAVRRGEYAKITTTVQQVLGWIRAARLS